MNGFLFRIFRNGGVVLLLDSWPSHAEYQQHLVKTLSDMAKKWPFALWEYEVPISKLYILSLDPLKSLLAPLYSPIGVCCLILAFIYSFLICPPAGSLWRALFRLLFIWLFLSPFLGWIFRPFFL